MKKSAKYLILLNCLLGASLPLQAQGLGIGSEGIVGMPDTTRFGDTLRNMHVWVVNRGITPVSGITVQVLALPSLGSPLTMGTLDLTLGLLPAGDSTSVPLDYFVVSPQNSNTGSNIMVIWPFAPGSSPGDTAQDGYWVDGTTPRPEPATPEVVVSVFPNPSEGKFQLHFSQPPGLTAEISIYHANGQLLERRKFQTTEILDLGHLKDGLYYYQIVTENGVANKGKLMIRKG